MLPSFRLIAITFCCGFIVVFAGLRLATSVNGLHKAMPVMAAHAAPVTVGAIADRDLRRGQSAVPVMYDMRFAVGTAVPAAAGSQPTIDRAPSVMMPLVILPPIALEAQRSAAAEPATAVIAALAPEPAVPPAPAAAIDIPFVEPATVDLTLPSQPKAKLPAAPAVAALAPKAATPAPRVVIDLPLPEPAPVDLTFAPPAKPQPAKDKSQEKPKEKPAVAAAAPQTNPQAPPRVFDIPLPDPAAVDLTLPPAKPEAEAGQEKRPETDASSKSSMTDPPMVVAALSEEALVGTVKLPTKRIPLPKPRGTVNTAALAQTPAAKPAAAKPAPRRKAAAPKNDFDNLFGFPTGKPF